MKLNTESKQSIAIDRYTKFILTIIAACLVIQVTKPFFDGNLIQSVQAEESASEAFSLGAFSKWFHDAYGVAKYSDGYAIRVHIANNDFHAIPVKGSTQDDNPAIVVKGPDEDGAIKTLPLRSGF